MDRNSLLPQIIAIAEEAGDAILEIYERGTDFEIDTKADATPVTEADLLAHQLIVTSLQRLTPEIPIISEESDPADHKLRQSWPRHWLVDPLDGTKEFIKRNGEFTVNIALVESGRPVLGVVYVPVTRSIYAGMPGFGAFKQDSRGKAQRLQTKAVKPYSKICLVTSRSHLDPRLDHYVEGLEQAAPITCTAIGSSLKLCLIAEGLADIHIRLGRTCEWDIAAAQAVLVAAGGMVIDFDNNPLAYNQKSDLYNPDFLAVADPDFNWFDYLPST
ncbi:MAG: 3'(2'),5'-bisphosphate nucleotidase CysQ [Motiliproteus sp.]